VDRSDFRKNSFKRICRFHKDGPFRASDVPTAGRRSYRSPDDALSRCRAQTKKKLDPMLRPLPQAHQQRRVKLCGRARGTNLTKRRFLQAWERAEINETFVKVEGCDDRRRLDSRPTGGSPDQFTASFLPLVLLGLFDRVSLCA
jgi:hypothetical protein